MTTETKPRSTRHVILSEELFKVLEATSEATAEEVIMLRIVVRKGIARKVKWTREEEECYA